MGTRYRKIWEKLSEYADGEWMNGELKMKPENSKLVSYHPTWITYHKWKTIGLLDKECLSPSNIQLQIQISKK